MKCKLLFILFLIPAFLFAQNGPTLQEQYDAMSDPNKEKSLKEKYQDYYKEIDEIANEALNKKQSESFDTAHLDNSEYVKSKIQSLKDKSYPNPLKAGQVQSFNPSKYYLKRFQESPCYNELGFSLYWDQQQLEKSYEECETKKSKEFWNYVLRTGFYSLILLGGILLMIRVSLKF